MEEGQVIESRLVSRRIEGAQKKVEEQNFDIRKHLLEYDEVMDFQRKSVYGYRQRILDGANCKELIFEMIDEQVNRHLGEFLAKDYEAESFAAWVGIRLNMEFETRDFRGMDYSQAEEFALDHARRMAESLVLDQIEENLPADAEETEWNWQALARWSNSIWRTSYTDRDLKKIPREELAEVLIEKARKFIDHVDLSDGRELLSRDYGLKTAIAWVKQKFDIELNFEEVKQLETDKFHEKVRKLTHEKYREQEIQYPVRCSLSHFTIQDPLGGRRYDRKGLIDWAQSRFGTELSLDDLKNMQRKEIEEVMFAQSRIMSERATVVYQELRRRLDELMIHNGLNPDEIRQSIANANANSDAGKVSAGSKFAMRSVNKTATKYTGKYATSKSVARTEHSLNQPPKKIEHNEELEKFCEWINKEFAPDLTSQKILEWDIYELEDRLCSLVEYRYNHEMRQMERSLVLQMLDVIWKDHLLVMDHLRSGIGLRGYAQEDPKVVFKREGMQIFAEMWNTVYSRVTDLIFRMEQLDLDFASSTWQETEEQHAEVQPNATLSDFEKEQTQTADNIMTSDKKIEPIRNRSPQIGRNDPCPCGSGKKYKNCHMPK
ncbi:MAG: SEC-C domain-containing protein [Planctomycetaceae bacterium]|nr:SEC-C domain-containing protein [Planctomycetaceae bacterium]